MLAKNLDELYFSQSALIAYQTCPLKFRRRYLEGLFWPADWGSDQRQRESVELGKQFHLLAQRYYSRGEEPAQRELLGELLNEWYDRLVEFRPYHERNSLSVQSNTRSLFLPEHELRLNDGGVKLIAKYDLLHVAPNGRVIIYDWKTNASRPLANYWRNHLQTIIYRYVLCKAGGVYSPQGKWQPDDITMIYWNPRFPHEFEPLTYTQKQFAVDEERIQKLIMEIKSLSFDQFLATGEQKHCTRCEYSPICHGKRAVLIELEEDDADFDLDWEAVEGLQI